MAELRSEEEQLEVVKRWWKENGTSLIAGAVLAAAGVFGWNAWQNYQEGKSEAASARYQQLINMTAERCRLVKNSREGKIFAIISIAWACHTCTANHTLITRLNGSLETRLVHPGKKVDVFPVGLCIDNQADEDSRSLGNTLEHQYTRKHRPVREMAVEEGFVCRYVLQCPKAFSGRDRDNTINQQEGITMRQNFPNSVNIDFCFHNLSLVGFSSTVVRKRVRTSDGTNPWRRLQRNSARRSSTRSVISIASLT